MRARPGRRRLAIGLMRLKTMTTGRYVIAALAALCLAAIGRPAQGQQAEARTISGATLNGQVARIDAENVYIDTAEKRLTVAAEDLESIAFSGDDPEIEEADKEFQWMVVTAVQGEILRAKSLSCAQGKADMTGLGWEIRGADTSALARAVRTSALGGTELKDSPYGAITPSETTDIVVLSGEKSDIQVDGTLKSLDGKELVWEIEGAVKRIPAVRVKALVFRRHAAGAPTPPAAKLALFDGSIAVLKALRLEGDLLTGRWSGGAFSATMPNPKLIMFQSIRVAYLSDREPERIEVRPFFDIPWAPRRDLSIEGKPLRIQGTRYTKGLGTHPYCRMVYRIEGEGFKALWYPDGEAIAKAVEYGRMFARAF